MNTECKEVERKVQDCNQQLATNLQDQVNWHCAYLLLVTDEHYTTFQPVCSLTWVPIHYPLLFWVQTIQLFPG